MSEIENEEIIEETQNTEDVEDTVNEHEEYLNSFPATTVFYKEIVTRPDGSKSLGTPIKNARLAESWGFLENHYDESELTYVGTDKCGIWYLKGHEAPEESLEQLQLDRYHLIDSQIEAYLDAKVKEHNYANVVSCVSYYNNTDDKYRAEARAVSEWRDHVYRTGEIVWKSVLDGTVSYEDVDLQYIIGIAGDFTWPEVE